MSGRIRFAAQEDLTPLAALWKLCFGDTDDYPERFLEKCLEAQGSGVLLWEEEREIVGMLCLVGVHCPKRGLSGGYLYAVCTHPSARGKGICHRLIEQAGRQADFLCLIPAKASLAEFYRGMGFSRSMTVPIGKANEGARGEAIECDLLPDPAFADLIEEALICASNAEKEEKISCGARKIYEICWYSKKQSVIMEDRGLCTPHAALPLHPIASVLPL